jgi:glycosyltransferase involved in cell wall biosynthesis
MSAGRPVHVVLIPSYNTGARLLETVAAVRELARPLIVVIDGSTDGTGELLARMAERDRGIICRVLPRNQGKGAAILHGLHVARSMGFTHALTMDADGQHSAAHIEEMIGVSFTHPDAMVLGLPLFDETAPRIRILGHKVANFVTGLVTRRGCIGDSLFGFRVYPIAPLVEIFANTSGMRRFDFDSEAVIRLHWRGVRAINVTTPVRYFRDGEGGVSHFKYTRDNLLLAAMYVRLFAALPWRPALSPFGSPRPKLDSGTLRQGPGEPGREISRVLSKEFNMEVQRRRAENI